MIQAYNKMHCDVLNVGEFDLTLGIDFLRRLQEVSSFPFISSNLLNGKDYQLLFKPYVVKTIRGSRIGIFGLLSPGAVQTKEEIFVQDPFVTAKHMVDELSSRVDLIVCLSNLGLSGNKRLSKEVPGIHVIVESGSGILLSPALVENGTVILESYQKGEYLGIFEVKTAPSPGGTLQTNQYRNVVVALDQKYPVDAEVGAMIADFKSRYKPSPGFPFPPLK